MHILSGYCHDKGRGDYFLMRLLRLKDFFYLLSPFGTGAKTVTAITLCDFDGGTEQHLMVCCPKSATRGEEYQKF
jgi:hypothetical protein